MISGMVLGQLLLIDNIEVSDYVSAQLPPIEYNTVEVNGSGTLGPVSMPGITQPGALSMPLTLSNVSAENMRAFRPGMVQQLELRIATDQITSEGNNVPEGTKIFGTGRLAKFDPGSIENGTARSVTVEYQLTRYRIVINGSEVVLLDKINNVNHLYGNDLLAEVNRILGRA